MARARFVRLAPTVALAAFVAAGHPASLSAQGDLPSTGSPPTGESDRPPGSHLEILLMTIGPGDAVWEQFSHNAIVIRDERAGTDVAYNWGIFNFNDADYYPRLARGQMCV